MSRPLPNNICLHLVEVEGHRPVVLFTRQNADGVAVEMVAVAPTIAMEEVQRQFASALAEAPGQLGPLMEALAAESEKVREKADAQFAERAAIRTSELMKELTLIGDAAEAAFIQAHMPDAAFVEDMAAEVAALRARWSATALYSKAVWIRVAKAARSMGEVVEVDDGADEGPPPVAGPPAVVAADLPGAVDGEGPAVPVVPAALAPAPKPRRARGRAA